MQPIKTCQPCEILIRYRIKPKSWGLRINHHKSIKEEFNISNTSELST